MQFLFWYDKIQCLAGKLFSPNCFMPRIILIFNFEKKNVWFKKYIEYKRSNELILLYEIQSEMKEACLSVCL